MKIPLIYIITVIIFSVTISCNKKVAPSPESVEGAVQVIQNYADTFVGMKVEDVKRKLPSAIITEEEWIDEGVIDGKIITAECGQYDMLLMCHKGSVLTATVDIITTK